MSSEVKFALAAVVLVALVIVAVLLFRRSPEMPNPSFQFTVEDVFYIKPPVDRVILVGTVKEGVVRAGDSAVVHCSGGPTAVVVEGIEALGQGTTSDIPQAGKGQQVGLRLRGITQDKASRGDLVTGEGTP